MPDPTGNTMELSIKQSLSATGAPQDCLKTKPPQLRIIQSQHPQIILSADPANTRSITLNFGASSAGDLFDPAPPPVVVLAPNATVTLQLKSSLGLHHRGTFVDTDPQFARTFTLHTDPAQRCGDGDLADVVVET
ncbi:MAG: hypothetical protein JWO80_280 [Bryobacterales bacterium]|nr:hypothetical protein [Bryobacterales bacterium]